jgi:HEAT repeat protein
VGGKRFLLIVSLFLALAAFGWWQRAPLLAWYYVRGLAGAREAERDQWVERVCGLDRAVLPSLLTRLRRDNAPACENTGAALVHLVTSWGNADPRALMLAEQMTEEFPGFSKCGQQAALACALELLKGKAGAAPPSAKVVLATGRMLALAALSQDAGVQAAALALAELLVSSDTPGAWRECFHTVVSAGSKSPDPACRVQAIRLTMHEALREDSELRALVIPLLHDPQTPVRRAALLAVGMAEQAVSEDELLPLLHDTDDDVRRLCEEALRGRGLRESHLKLARLISDARPGARLEVLDHLRCASDLEPGAWLRRLSADPSPAVRAAAVRAAASQTDVDLSDRLRQVAREDPSPTVRQIAAHYCGQHVQELTAQRSSQ